MRILCALLAVLCLACRARGLAAPSPRAVKAAVKKGVSRGVRALLKDPRQRGLLAALLALNLNYATNTTLLPMSRARMGFSRSDPGGSGRP